MPRIGQLIRLFTTLGLQDWDSCQSEAQKIVDYEEQKGNISAAKKLKAALKSGPGQSSAARPVPETQGLARILIRIPEGKCLREISLKQSNRGILEELLREWSATKVLKKFGIPRRHRLLFSGPPGCGKTLTAAAIARELGIPAYVVRFDSLIGAYLGQTAANLRDVFHFASLNNCVILIDEIDVLAKKRGNSMDVGELDRIVVGLMQELDLSTPKGLIIGATNLQDQLDPALLRRFDLRVEFPAPNRSELTKYITSFCSKMSFKASPAILKRAESSPSFAVAERVLTDAVRSKLIKDFSDER